MALHHGAAGIKNVPAAPAAVKPDSTSTSSNTVVDWIETKSQVATVLSSKEVAYSSQEELFATVLYKANFALLCQICQTSNLHCQLSTSSKRGLGHVRDRMCLWGDALGDGRLEACLSPQDELHKSLISLLDRIGKTLITGSTMIKDTVGRCANSTQSWNSRPAFGKARRQNGAW
jgi:hypothetical protein